MITSPHLFKGEIMLTTPEVAHIEAQPVAFIRFTIPRHEAPEVMGPGYQELMETIAAQGIAPAGPWFNHHLHIDAETFDFELSVPVTAPVTPTGRVHSGVRPAGNVIRTVYQGGYEGLGDAWGTFDAQIAAQGYRTGGDLYECYLAGPETSPDPSQWRTELSRSLVDG
jgi:effector-binding domain-containing protein